MPQYRGSFTPAQGILFTRKRGLLYSTFFFIAQHQRGNSQPAHLRGNSQLALFCVTSWQPLALRAPRPSWTAPSGRDSPSCRIPTTRAAVTSLCALKANLALRGVPHASTCALPVRNLRSALCPSVTCAVRSANRTPCAGHVEFHTRARPENPSIPNPSTQPCFCPSRDRQHSPWAFPDRVSLP